jgi:hypothetical protein
MELTDLATISAENYGDLQAAIEKEKASRDVETFLKQLDPDQHDVVANKLKRPDKQKTDSNGSTSTVPVARLPLTIQKLIVNRAAAFLCGRPIQLQSDPVDDSQIGFTAVIQKVWDDNKLGFKSITLAEIMMGETECAELWYMVPAEEEYWFETAAEGAKFKPRVKILANSYGDKLYPVFDQFGDMIAFGRSYKIKVAGQDQECYDIYMADKTYLGRKGESGWEVTQEPNPAKKIPIIYYSQPSPEWADVQALIDRLETQLSNLADTNDYFGSPIVFVEGDVVGFADKGDTGKVLKGTPGAKAEYLTWDRSPESVKLELESLKKYINQLTDTPDISIEEMKGLGTFSGVALRLLFLPAHLKAARKEGIFGEGIQRRINYLKASMASAQTSFQSVVGMQIKPRFEYYLPQNEQEMVDLLTTAVGVGKPIMSQESAIRANPLVTDPDAEIQKMTDEGSLGADIQTA